MAKANLSKWDCSGLESIKLTCRLELVQLFGGVKVVGEVVKHDHLCEVRKSSFENSNAGQSEAQESEKGHFWDIL